MFYSNKNGHNHLLGKVRALTDKRVTNVFVQFTFILKGIIFKNEHNSVKINHQ